MRENWFGNHERYSPREEEKKENENQPFLFFRFDCFSFFYFFYFDFKSLASKSTGWYFSFRDPFKSPRNDLSFIYGCLVFLFFCSRIDFFLKSE